MVTGDLDEGRIGGFERQHALVCQICRVCHKGQLRGLSDSNARPDVHWLPAEASAVVALHREAAALETARKQHRELALARAVPTRPDVPVERQANQGRQQGQGNKGAKAEGGGATSDRVLIFRILAQLVLATVHGSSRDIKVGGPCCRIDVLFFPRNRVYEICRRGDRHSPCPSTTQGGAGSRCPPAHAIVRAAIATKREPGLSSSYRVVSYGSPMEVWALLVRSLSLPAYTQRSIRRGAALASRLDPLASSGGEHGRCKTQFFAVLNGTAISDPEPVRFSCDPGNWAHSQATSESTAKDIIHLSKYQLPRPCCSCAAARLASRMCGARFLQP